jgi:putative DNA primase/helicase
MNKYQEERLAAALQYAARGWRVLPVGSNKRPINHNGSIGASTDTKQILAWWKETPYANIGVACGPESFWVVDIDMKDGVDGLASLMKEFPTVSVDNNFLFAQTATGGFHLVFKWPKNGVIKNAQGILPGVDIRGEGGYIVVAPSARKIEDKYVQYQWNNLALDIAKAPEWAQDLARRQETKVAQGVDLTAVMSGLGAGERDTELFRYACHLSSREVPYDIAYAFLTVAADRCKPPFAHATVEEKLKRAYSYERKTKPTSEDKRSNMLALIKESNHERK